jgi:hypothetical protein
VEARIYRPPAGVDASIGTVGADVISPSWDEKIRKLDEIPPPVAAVALSPSIRLSYLPMHAVYCSQCGKQKSVSTNLYLQLFAAYSGGFMLCDDIDCMGIYQAEPSEQEKTSA